MYPLDQEQRTPIPTTGEQLRELTVSLQREVRITEELGEALVNQRTAVAADDPPAVNASVEAIGRILLTLNAARRRRSDLLSAITGGDPVPLDALEGVVGQPLPMRMTEAVRELRRAALKVTQEVKINRTVLRRAVETGEAFLQALFSAAVDPEPVYHPSDKKEEGRGGPGFLVDRMV